MVIKAHVVTKLARQVEGDLVFVQWIRGFTNKDKMKEYVNSMTFNQVEQINGINCMVEIGIIEDVEVEVEDKEANEPSTV